MADNCLLNKILFSVNNKSIIIDDIFYYLNSYPKETGLCDLLINYLFSYNPKELYFFMPELVLCN